MTTNARLEALLDKAYWGWDPAKIPDAPVAALRGVSDADAVELGHSLGIRTIRDLATNRFVLAAQELLQAASAPPVVAPTETFEEMLARVAGEAGLSGLPRQIAEAEVQAQLARFGGRPDFEAAFRSALAAILTNDEDIESPRALFRGEFPTDPNLLGTLQAYLNRPTARIALVRLADLDEDTREISPPEHGESLSEFWAFSLSIRDFSDHLYWALVPRANPTTGSVYGFN